LRIAENRDVVAGGELLHDRAIQDPEAFVHRRLEGQGQHAGDWVELFGREQRLRHGAKLIGLNEQRLDGVDVLLRGYRHSGAAQDQRVIRVECRR
jgi:hypothetical protein